MASTPAQLRALLPILGFTAALPACGGQTRAWTCVPGQGLASPLPTCTTQDPCDRVIITDRFGGDLTTPNPEPSCKSGWMAAVNRRAAFDDGDPQQLTTPDGMTRYFCQGTPEGTSPSSPRPLIIFFPGSGGTATNAYDLTSLRQKATSFDVTGDPARPGFIFVAAQARNLHWPTATAQDGTKFDTFFRDATSPSSNPDVAYVDAVVDNLVAQGLVDPRHIYAMGWSNGGRMASLYGLARHETPTPGGARIAAVANFSSGDPFSNLNATQEPSCQVNPYPRSPLPLVVISRDCDLVACNQAQADSMVRLGGSPPEPGNVMEPWVNVLQRDIAASVLWILVDQAGHDVDGCASVCTPAQATRNHTRWIDARAHRGGPDLEERLLDFLRDHPLP